MNDDAKPDYRGKRALILTRVSTAKQEEKYSHDAQERQVREKLIAPLGLRIMDEARHIIRDTYSGLEYRYREALGRILEMAERGEFDVLCMDVLDRGLGRKALARELYRMQLKELGVRVLTTDPSDYADDDSLTGQIMRFHKGIKAEEEINDLVRRTRDGKREKALGNAAKGIPQKLVGVGQPLYGYQFVSDKEGIHIGFALNLAIVCTEVDGTEWTEVKVVVFIFESAAQGVSVREICRILNKKGIPSPAATKGIQHKKMKGTPTWQPTTVRRMLDHSAYYGEYRQFRTKSIGRVPGLRTAPQRATPLEEQVIFAVPAIVTQELAERAQSRVAGNKRLATRNNKTSKESLLRGGLARCGYCNATLRVYSKLDTRKSGKQTMYFSYNCITPYNHVGKCQGCSISVDLLDNEAWLEAVKVIRDPSDVDAKIQKLTRESTVTRQRKRIQKNLTELSKEQETLRANLAKAMRKDILNEKAITFLNSELSLLEKQENEARSQLADEQAMQRKIDKLLQRIATFHQQCSEWRGKLDDPQFILSYEFKREALRFFGINATVYKIGTKPRCLIHTDVPDIVDLLR